jgi:hypothetical protein
MTDTTNNILAGYRTEEEQASLLDLTVRTLRGWRKKRTGPPWTRKGKQYLYNDEWTAEWLRSGKQQPVRERRRARQRAYDHAAGSAA